jgi:CheY-like chemotaxis protein
MLFLDFHDRQDQARRVENDGQLTTLWSVSADQTSVSFQPASVVIAAYRDAADAGSRLRRVGGLTPENVQAVLAADLAYRVMIDPDWGDPDQIQAVRAAHGSATAGWSLSAAIGLALELGDHAATIGLIRMVDSETSDADRDMLLTGSGASPTPLVNAASSPHPRVRYEAALAVARLRLAEGGRRYPGSSRVMHCLSEMRSLGEQPTAILVETRSEVVLHMERLLGSIGFEVEVVGSVSQLQRRVARGGDLRMILSKTQLSDLPPVELIDLVRRIDRGHELPIVFYGSKPAAGIQGARWQTPTMLIDLPVSAAAFDGMLDAVARKRRVPALSVIDRQSYRNAAITLLDRLAQVR